MENHTAAASHKTQLKNRTLWYDGDSSFDPNSLLYLANVFPIKYVNSLTEAIVEYNKNVPREKEMVVKTESRPIKPEWTIPQKLQTLDVEQFLFDAHDVLMEGVDPEEIKQREYRLCHEIIKYKKLNLLPVLRAIIWIINRFEYNDVVWGVGRGSSVSSYVLYVIGVHDVDSFAYELDIDDFLHE